LKVLHFSFDLNTPRDYFKIINCLAPLTKEDPLSGVNQEELRVNAENNGQRFLELAHRMDAAFLQKRFLLSVQKPELLILEENHEMKNEIAKKDELIKKQTEKLAEWQNTLSNLINRVGSVPSQSGGTRPPTVVGVPNQSPVPPSHMSLISGGGTPSSVQSSMPIAPPPSSMNMVGGMSHGPSTPHSMNSPMSLPNTMSHQPMMGQVNNTSNTTMSMMNQGGYQPMSNMSGSGGPMHTGGTMGGNPQSSIGPMGGTQGAPGQGPIGVGAGNMGTNMGVGSGGPSGGNMFHGAVPPMGQTQGGLQGPLAYLEKTTTNIGMPEPRSSISICNKSK
ncbi:Mediator of RNA polymerase II transcription subunit 28, partial [Armadillidium vulgare]